MVNFFFNVSILKHFVWETKIDIEILVGHAVLELLIKTTAALYKPKFQVFLEIISR